MSPRKAVVETYIEGFRRSDHERILSCLTEDVVWELPGYTGERISRLESYQVNLS